MYREDNQKGSGGGTAWGIQLHIQRTKTKAILHWHPNPVSPFWMLDLTTTAFQLSSVFNQTSTEWWVTEENTIPNICPLTAKHQATSLVKDYSLHYKSINYSKLVYSYASLNKQNIQIFHISIDTKKTQTQNPVNNSLAFAPLHITKWISFPFPHKASRWEVTSHLFPFA